MPKVFIKGFNSNSELCKEKFLWPVFSIFGQLKTIKVFNNSTTKSITTAIIEYSTMEEATAAISAIHGKRLCDGSVIIADIYYNPRKRVVINRYSYSNNSNNTNIGLSTKIILNEFEKYGKIYNYKITPIYIYIDYYSETDANAVINKGKITVNYKISSNEKSNYKMSATNINSNTNNNSTNTNNNISAISTIPADQIHSIIFYPFKPNDIFAAQEQTIFIYNLPNNYTEKDLINKFSKYGEIISCGFNNKEKVGKERVGKGGVVGGSTENRESITSNFNITDTFAITTKNGYINYADKKSCFKAYKAMDNRKIQDKYIKVKIKNIK